jgi:DNA mismatch repair protein PMS2
LPSFRVLFFRLVVRQNLELPATSELTVMNHLKTFQANGFDFDIEEESEPTKRIFLTQIPHSKNWTFGKQVFNPTSTREH